MTWGLGLIRILIAGTIMYNNKDRLQFSDDWQIRFVLTAIIFALVEEAIATIMTNMAPFFGLKIGDAYITASENYFDIILFHSVIVFIPMFIA